MLIDDIRRIDELLNNISAKLEEKQNYPDYLRTVVELELKFKRFVQIMGNIKAKFVPEQEIGVCEVDNLFLYRENVALTSATYAENVALTSVVNNITNTSNTPVTPATYVENVAHCVHIEELNTNIKLKTVEHLRDIPNAFYWFRGNNKHRAGMYCRIYDNFIRVPFPNIIDSFETRDKTISCKNMTRRNCEMWRGRFDRKHDAAKLPAGKPDCMFAHETEKINKIGIQARCPSAPQFGNPPTFHADIEKINKLDLVRILLYSVNDLGLAYIYMQNKGLKGKTIDNLEYIIDL